jgi:hypothetical protein
VEIAVPDASASAGLNAAPDELAPAFPPTRSSFPQTPLNQPGVVDTRYAVRAALKAGVLGVFIGMIPLLGIVLTGALAVYFYRRESRFVLPAALGSRLGGAAGVVAFAINALLLTIRIFVFHAQQEYVDLLTRFAHTVGANASDPDFQASIHSLVTPVGLAITCFFGIIIVLVLASIGGALASLVLRPGKTRG